MKLKVLAWVCLLAGVYTLIVGILLLIRLNQPPYAEAEMLTQAGQIVTHIRNSTTSVEAASGQLFLLLNATVGLAKKALLPLLFSAITLTAFSVSAIIFCWKSNQEDVTNP